MQFWEWKNKRIGDFNIFAVLNENEKNELLAHYGTPLAESISLSEKYYYFINSKRKIITPMPELYFAFGGQYNGYPPYGNEITNFTLVLLDYELVVYEDKDDDE